MLSLSRLVVKGGLDPACKSLQVVTGAVCANSQRKRLPKYGREEEASQKEGISVNSKKKGTQIEGNWDSLSHTAVSTKPVSRLGMLLCLEEQGGFFACVY